MISQKALLHDSDDYHPLGSVRSVMNVPTKPDFKNVDMVKVFLCAGNMSLMSKSLHQVHRSIGGRSGIETFNELVPVLARQFVRTRDLRQYQSVEYEAVGFNNHVDLLKSINTEFQKYCYSYLRWNAFVPTREWTEVGASDDRKQKRMSELTAEDIPTIDVWQKQEISVMSKFFRDNNRIPFWQHTMHNRHYDRGNCGLKTTPDRSSLDNFQRGFKMDSIYSALDKWTEDDWFGM